MLKLTIALLAFMLAGTASAAGWRSMRLDASSEDAFNRSVIALSNELPRVRRVVFERSLQDIWVEGLKAAEADGRDYTVADYLRELDDLGYEEVVKFTDPSGDTADRYFDEAYVTLFMRSVSPYGRMVFSGSSPSVSTGGPKLGAASQPNWN